MVLVLCDVWVYLCQFEIFVQLFIGVDYFGGQKQVVIWFVVVGQYYQWVFGDIDVGVVVGVVFGVGDVMIFLDLVLIGVIEKCGFFSYVCDDFGGIDRFGLCEIILFW